MQQWRDCASVTTPDQKWIFSTGTGSGAGAGVIFHHSAFEIIMFIYTLPRFVTGVKKKFCNQES